MCSHGIEGISLDLEFVLDGDIEVHAIDMDYPVRFRPGNQRDLKSPTSIVPLGHFDVADRFVQLLPDRENQVPSRFRDLHGSTDLRDLNGPFGGNLEIIRIGTAFV